MITYKVYQQPEKIVLTRPFSHLESVLMFLKLHKTVCDCCNITQSFEKYCFEKILGV